jgi:hypothetical protein
LSESSFESYTVSTLNSQEKLAHKTQWPSVEEIENILGFRIRPVVIPKIIEEIKEEPAAVDSAKAKGKKSALKKPVEKSPTSAKKRILVKSSCSEPNVEEPKHVIEAANTVQINNEPINDVKIPDTLIINENEVKSENELPTPLCPSSLKFSKKLGVRLWIEHSNFESSLKTTPLI